MRPVKRLFLASLVLAGCVFGSHQGVVRAANLTNPVSGWMATTRSGLVVTVALEGAAKTPTLKVFDGAGALVASRSVANFASTCNAANNNTCRQMLALTEDDNGDNESFLVLFDNGYLWRGVVNLASGTISESGSSARLAGVEGWVDVVHDASRVVPMHGAAVYSRAGGDCADGRQPLMAWSKGRAGVGFGEPPVNLRPQLGCNVNNLRIAQDHQSGRFAVLGGNKIALYGWNDTTQVPTHEKTITLTAHNGYVYTDLALEYGQLVISERRTSGGQSYLYTVASTTGEVQSTRAVREAFSVAFSYAQGDSAFAWYNGASTDQAYKVGRFPLYAE